MNLKEREIIQLIRYRSRLSQEIFYKDFCDQQTGSWIENHFERGVDPGMEEIVDSILKDGIINDLTIGEIARVLRMRCGDTIHQAAKKTDMSHVWVIAAERGKYFAEKLYRLYR